MIYELRTHTIRPGCELSVADATKLLIEIRGDSWADWKVVEHLTPVI